MCIVCKCDPFCISMHNCNCLVLNCRYFLNEIYKIIMHQNINHDAIPVAQKNDETMPQIVMM